MTHERIGQGVHHAADEPGQTIRREHAEKDLLADQRLQTGAFRRQVEIDADTHNRGGYLPAGGADGEQNPLPEGQVSIEGVFLNVGSSAVLAINHSFGTHRSKLHLRTSGGTYEHY